MLFEVRACRMLSRVERFDRVVLIYNPVNRRVPLTMAESMRDELGRRLPDLPVVLRATQYVGHARELARGVAATGAPLIVAVSGDGVYNEVVTVSWMYLATRHSPLSPPAGTPMTIDAAPAGCLCWTRSSPPIARVVHAIWICCCSQAVPPPMVAGAAT